MTGFLDVLLTAAGFWVFVAVLAISLVWWVLRRERYSARLQSGHALPTSEVHIDPVTGRRQRVWIDPLSGDRAYLDEPHGLPPNLPPLARPGLLAHPDWGRGQAHPGLTDGAGHGGAGAQQPWQVGAEQVVDAPATRVPPTAEGPPPPSLR